MNAEHDAPSVRPRGLRLVVQLLGFVIGCGLVVWCIKRALATGGDGLTALRHADPRMVAALLGSTLVSLICSGFTFRAMARPIRRFGVVEMQAINLMASLFNYAPVRLGLALRCAFHWRVDGLRTAQLAAWIAAVAIVTLGTVLSAAAAGLVQFPMGRTELTLGPLWFALFGAFLVAGTALTLLIGRAPMLRRFLKGAERVLVDRRALIEGLAWRTVDLAAWAVRMWAAAAIVGVTLHPAQAVLLASIAILGAGFPLGRIGYREMLVATVAPHVIGAGATPEQLDALTASMALLESAGEAALSIPLGLAGAAWCFYALRRASRTAPTDGGTP